MRAEGTGLGGGGALHSPIGHPSWGVKAWSLPCALGLPRVGKLPEEGPQCGPRAIASSLSPCGLRARPEQQSCLACTCRKAGSLWKMPKTPCWRLPGPFRPRVPLASPGPRCLPTARPGDIGRQACGVAEAPLQAWPNLHDTWPRPAAPSRVPCPTTESHRLAWASSERAQ